MRKPGRLGIPLLLFFLLSCGGKGRFSSGVLQQDTMQSVLWDIIKADAYTTDFIKNDTSKNAMVENAKLQNEVFAIHSISREDFYKSLDFYKKNPGSMRVMLDSMINKANRERVYNINTNPENQVPK